MFLKIKYAFKFKYLNTQDDVSRSECLLKFEYAFKFKYLNSHDDVSRTECLLKIENAFKFKYLNSQDDVIWNISIRKTMLVGRNASWKMNMLLSLRRCYMKYLNSQDNVSRSEFARRC